MIARYSTAAMRQLWSDEHKFSLWRDIEIAACEFWHSQGKISDSEMEEIRSRAQFSVTRIEEIEKTVQHDVIAFLTNLAENIGPAARHVHFGLTSSDVVDTAQMLLLQQAGALIDRAFVSLLSALYQFAQKHRDLIVAGRTHGVHAEPTTLGLKFLGHYAELLRARERFLHALEDCRYGKISGAVGTYSQMPPELESYVLAKFGLKVEPVSTQVIPRDRHAYLLQAIALSGQALYRLMQEIRLLQRTEGREIEEPFQEGQKGSSAMPHKRNPVLAERICGLARVLLGYAATAENNIPLWHERDISHSGAERIILPDATSLLEYMLLKSAFVVQNLHVHEDNCARVLAATHGLLFSSRALLAITEKTGMSREEAYAIVQQAAMATWENPQVGDLRSRLERDARLAALKSEDWDAVFDARSFLQHVGKIFARLPAPPQSAFTASI
ncbi:MAG: adenylosuccinate lyase [Leptospiraceae bacterium]|nr:adenylosuccinate lyase [Leptospiraceae bacterium]